MMFSSSNNRQMPMMIIPFANMIQANAAAENKEDISLSTLHDHSQMKEEIKRMENKSTSSRIEELKDDEADGEDLLHSGAVLGKLPALTPSKSSPIKTSQNAFNQSEMDAALLNDHSSTTTHRKLLSSLSADADDKLKNAKKKVAVGASPDLTSGSDIPTSQIPKQYLCQLTQKLMSEPMKTLYGNIYDKTAIYQWFSQQGRICPLTGCPLAEIDLIPLPELQKEIREWILKRSLSSQNQSQEGGGAAGSEGGERERRGETSSLTKEKSNLKKKEMKGTAGSSNNNDDLYDF
jgi:hypothetical protein